MTIALGIVIILLAIALTVLVLMQSGKGKELSGVIAGGNSNSYLGNNGGTSKKDKLLFRLTCILAAVFVVCVLVLYVLA